MNRIMTTSRAPLEGRLTALVRISSARPEIESFNPMPVVDLFFGKKKRRVKQAPRRRQEKQKFTSFIDEFWNNIEMWAEIEEKNA